MLHFYPVRQVTGSRKCSSCPALLVHVWGRRRCAKCHRAGPYVVSLCLTQVLLRQVDAMEAARDVAEGRPCVCEARGLVGRSGT